MNTSDFDYHLPTERIAQSPAVPRDTSRLMILDREKKTLEQGHFFDIAHYLRSGDVLVWNNSKVFKARLHGHLLSSDGSTLLDHKKPVEIFLVCALPNPGVWRVLAKPGRHVRNGMRILFSELRDLSQTLPYKVKDDIVDFYCDVMVKEPDGTILVQFPDDEETVRQKANRYGAVPLPPYIKDEKHELETYQTVYATHEGSVAAPTAGFHFTPSLIEKLKDKGVEFADVTLHVGLGTFLPVKSERVEDHTMHSEWVELTEENAEKINRAKREGRRVVAVGTTTVRTLEGIAGLQPTVNSQQTSLSTVDRRPSTVVLAYSGDINIFITPGFEFRVVDALITNFHLPKSTLLILVSAFAGDRKFVLECYEKAIEEQYRFYSFGDAMFIQ